MIDHKMTRTVDDIRGMAARSKKFRMELQRAASLLAKDVALGKAPQSDHRLALPVKNVAGNVVGRYLGPATSRFTGVKLSLRLRVGYAQAVIAWASALLADPAFTGVSALDRVEYSARAIIGVRQGRRMSPALLHKLEESVEDLEELEFRRQMLVFYNTNAPRHAFDALTKWDKDLYPDLQVEVQPVNFTSFDDDAAASETRQRRDSEWVNVFIDGEVVGVHRVTGASTWNLDDWVDPHGNLRELDYEYPLSVEDWEWRKEERNRFNAWREAKREEKRVAAVKALRATLSPEQLAVHIRQEEERAEKQAAFSAARRKAALARAEAERVAAAKRLEVELQERQKSVAMFGVPGSHRNNPATGDDFKPEVARVYKREGLSDEAIARVVRNLEVTVAQSNDHSRQLREDADEARRFYTDDTRAWSNLDLIEETIAEFSSGVIIDDDLDLDKALQAVPALAAHVRDHKKLNKMPQGLMGVLALARQEEAAMEPARIANTRFAEGLALLAAAAADEDDSE